jgi:MFS family permease
LWRDTDYTVREALRTPAFWILAFFSMVGFTAQAGVSLHQAAHYVDAGVSHGQAALVATSFAMGQIPGGMVWSAVGRRIPVRLMLAISAVWLAGGVFGIAFSQQLVWGILFGFLFGAGVGGLHTLLRLAWADYYGRIHLGAIRGITLPAQIGGQAIGPVVSGFMFDASGDYRVPFVIFAAAVALSAVLVLAAVPPGRGAREE